MSRLRTLTALFTCLASAAAFAATPIQPKTVFYGDSNTYDWKLPQNSNAFQVNRNWNNQAFNSPTTSNRDAGPVFDRRGVLPPDRGPYHGWVL